MKEKIQSRIEELAETEKYYADKRNTLLDQHQFSEAQYFAMKIDQINFAIRELKDILLCCS
jgi:hypothetical protein